MIDGRLAAGLTRDRREVGVAQLERDRVRRARGVLEAAATWWRSGQCVAQIRTVRQVVRERRLGADGLALVLRLDAAVVDAEREVAQVEAVRSEEARRVDLELRREIAEPFGYRRDAAPARSWGLRPKATREAAAPGTRPRRRGTMTRPSGLPQVDAILATLLLAPTPMETVRPASPPSRVA